MRRKELTIWLTLFLFAVVYLVYIVATREQPKEDEQITEIKNYHNSEGRNIIVFE